MTPAAERYARIQELFDATADLPPEERAALLEKQCDGDVALRDEVEALLADDAQWRVRGCAARSIAIPATQRTAEA